MIRIRQIQLSKSLGMAWAIERLTDQGQWIPILDPQLIEASIIDTKAKASITLLKKQYWSTGRGLRRPDKTTSYVGLDVSL